MIVLYLTRPGSFRPLEYLPHNFLAASSVAMSIAWKGILLALRMVSRRDVAVMMCDDPAVRDV